ncbi:hypothetical protein ACSFBI_31730 [Variovorax sp. RB3P1]|uniref:hypothetical protein n=1 Tax=Variovorax sp. RB3P1 TaxID=3443732 RepID=UPI003F464412
MPQFDKADALRPLLNFVEVTLGRSKRLARISSSEDRDQFALERAASLKNLAEAFSH